MTDIKATIENNDEQETTNVINESRTPDTFAIAADPFGVPTDYVSRWGDKSWFAIQMNNCASNDPCAFCGARTSPRIGPEIFAAGTWSPACDRCTEEIAPELLHLREVYHRVAGEAYEEFARRREAGEAVDEELIGELTVDRLRRLAREDDPEPQDPRLPTPRDERVPERATERMDMAVCIERARTGINALMRRYGLAPVDPSTIDDPLIDEALELQRRGVTTFYYRVIGFRPDRGEVTAD